MLLCLVVATSAQANEAPERPARRFIRYDARWDVHHHDPGIPVESDADIERSMRLRDADTERDRATQTMPAFSIAPSAMPAVPPPRPAEETQRPRMWIRPTLDNEELGSLLWGPDEEESTEASQWGWLADEVGQRQRLREALETERLQLEEEDEEEQGFVRPTDASTGTDGLLSDSPFIFGFEGLTSGQREQARLENGELDRLLAGPEPLGEEQVSGNDVWSQAERLRDAERAADRSAGQNRSERPGEQQNTGAWRSVLLESADQDDFQPTADFSRRMYTQQPLSSSGNRDPGSWSNAETRTGRDWDHGASVTSSGNDERARWSSNDGLGQGWDPAPSPGTDNWSANWTSGVDWSSPSTVAPAVPESSISSGFSEPRRSVHDAGWMMDR